MCEILVKCQKCDKILISVDAKIYRTNRALKHCSAQTKAKLEGILEGLEFVKKKLKAHDCCEIVRCSDV